MRKISDTIARLAALQTQHAGSTTQERRSDRLQDLVDFGVNPGALRAKFYLPKDLRAHAPLVVVLHGCTQNAAGYDHHSGWSKLADEAGFAVLLPEQQRTNNPNLCFNWFELGDTRRDTGEVMSIRQMIGTMLEEHGLDRERIFITGLSAGGAVAGAMLATCPEVFAGGAIIAGLPYGSATSMPQAFDRMRGHGGPSGPELTRFVQGASSHKGRWPTISIWHGSADQTVAPANADAIADQWRGVHELAQAPTFKTVGRHSKSVWCNAAGKPLVEVNAIAGMGHGTPISNDDLGAPAPYMLDVGISSTREIARFWGIAPPTADRVNISTREVHAPRSSIQPRAAPHISKPEVKPAAPATIGSVKQVIEDALRAAGLMR